jgi:putative polyhydroxyalkanoate system protein
MAEINIERNHELGLDELRKRLDSMEAKLKERYGVKLAWRGAHEAEVKGTGVSGTISLGDKRVAVNLKLGLMVRPLAGKIREAMEKQLDKALV